MKDPLIWVLFALTGVFTYFAAFKGLIYIFLLVLMTLTAALWYVTTFLVTGKMAEKGCGLSGRPYVFVQGQYVKDGSESIPGALVFTSSEILFIKRHGFMGGTDVVWSSCPSALASYEMKEVADRKRGIEFTLNGKGEEIRIISSKISAKEEKIREILGWN